MIRRHLPGWIIFRKKGITPIRLDARKTNFKKAVVDGVKIACQEKIEAVIAAREF